MFRVDYCAGLLAALAIPLLALGCDSGNSGDNSGEVSASDTPAASTQSVSVTTETPAPQVIATFASVPAAIAELKTSANGDNDDQLRAVGEWLSAQGSAAIGPLVAVMNDASQSDKVRRSACRVLGEIGPAAREQLHAAVDSDNGYVQSMAIQSLGGLRPVEEESVRVLMNQLDHSDELVVRISIIALGSMGEPASIAVEQLQLMQNDNSLSDTLRSTAHESLRKIEPRRDFRSLGGS